MFIVYIAVECLVEEESRIRRVCFRKRRSVTMVADDGSFVKTRLQRRIDPIRGDEDPRVPVRPSITTPSVQDAASVTRIGKRKHTAHHVHHQANQKRTETRRSFLDCLVIPVGTKKKNALAHMEQEVETSHSL